MGATDFFCSCYRKAEVFPLPFLNQVLARPRHILDGHVGVHTVLIEQVDGLDPESLERALGALLDMLWPPILAHLLPSGTQFEADFGGDHHLLAQGSKRFAHQFFIGERTVTLGGVEKGNAAFDCRPDQCDHLLLVGNRAFIMAHSHATEPKGRDFQVIVSKCALLHVLTSSFYLSCLLSLRSRSERSSSTISPGSVWSFPVPSSQRPCR